MYFIYIFYDNGFGGKIGQQKQKAQNFLPKVVLKKLHNQKVKI